jgi:hypothetical protein
MFYRENEEVTVSVIIDISYKLAEGYSRKYTTLYI